MMAEEPATKLRAALLSGHAASPHRMSLTTIGLEGRDQVAINLVHLAHDALVTGLLDEFVAAGLLTRHLRRRAAAVVASTTENTREETLKHGHHPITSQRNSPQ